MRFNRYVRIMFDIIISLVIVSKFSILVIDIDCSVFCFSDVRYCLLFVLCNV